MATPYKLPSGTWCIKPYSHSEPVYNADGTPVLLPNGEQKTTRKYKTITGPTKKAVELAAAQFILHHDLPSNIRTAHRRKSPSPPAPRW